jgi:MFS family permease
MSSIPSPKTHWFHHRWTTLGLFTLISLVCYVDRFVLGALITPIKTELHLTDEQLGRLNLIFIFAYIIIIPLAGYLGDRLPRKWFIFGSLILWSAASIGSGLATAFGGLLFWRALVGVGEGIFASLSPSWIADLFGPKLRSFAFAMIQSTGQVAAWVAYALGGTIAAIWNWHDAFFVAGIPGLIRYWVSSSCESRGAARRMDISRSWPSRPSRRLASFSATRIICSISAVSRSGCSR